MSESVSLPALGESVTEGTVTRWLKQVGDRVEVDEPLLEVSTDKVDTEIPSPIAGVIEEILVAEDETVEVGADLVRIGDGSGGGATDAAPSTDEAPAAAVDAEVPAAGEPAQAPVADAESAQPEPSEAAAAPESVPSGAAPSSEAPDSPATPDSSPTPDDSDDAVGSSSPGDSASEPESDTARDQAQVSEAQVSGTQWNAPSADESTPGQHAEADSENGPVAEAGGSAPAGAATDDWAAAVAPAEASSTAWIAAPPPSFDQRSATDAEVPAAPSTEQEPGTEPVVDGGSSSTTDDGSAPETDPSQQEDPSAKHGSADRDSADRDSADQDSAEQEPAEQEPAAASDAPAAEPVESASTAESTTEAPSSEPTVPPEAAGADAAPHAAYVTPIVRKLASEKGIGLEGLTGTGVGGRIRKQDVLDAAEAASRPAVADEVPAEPVVAETPAPEPAATSVSALRGTNVPMSRLRRVVAERAVVSLQTSAQLTTVVEVDVTRVARYRDQVKAEFLEKTGTKLSFLPFFTLAAAEALRQYPIVNATIDTENAQIVYPDHEHISIAVDTERGLLTPVVRDVGDLSLAQLAEQIADLASRTRENKLKPDELAGGTFTVTNTGSRGALFDTPLVFLPQSAILGTGIVVKKPVVLSEDGQDSIAVRSMVYLALSYDHRIVDGADAARFLGTVKARLEEGDFASVLGI